MLAFRWRWSVAKNSAGFALARYKIPLPLVLHYKISAGAGANADQRTRPILIEMVGFITVPTTCSRLSIEMVGFMYLYIYLCISP